MGFQYFAHSYFNMASLSGGAGRDIRYNGSNIVNSGYATLV